jgi:endonuclease I
MNNYAKVNGYPNLLRDLDTNAIINVDSIESNNYDRIRKSNKRRREEIDVIKSDLHNIKSSINEIKSMLREIINES